MGQLVPPFPLKSEYIVLTGEYFRTSSLNEIEITEIGGSCQPKEPLKEKSPIFDNEIKEPDWNNGFQVI